MLHLKNILFKIFIELFIFDKKKRKIIKANWAKKHLKKYVDYAIENTVVNQKANDKNSSTIIWQYWHQGIENAPLLIKKCVESVKKCNPNKDIRVLSFETIKNYVEIPKRYYDLLNKGKMSIAHFSDILRLYLLATYGGTWIDATIYLTDKVPDKIINSDFCVPQKDPLKDMSRNKMTCYFIHSKNNNYLLHTLKNAIEKYWSENDFIINYFMFEHIATMLSETNEKLKTIWNNMPYLKLSDKDSLYCALFDDYSEERFNKLKENSFLHKTTWKFLDGKTSGHSFYDKIVNEK